MPLRVMIVEDEPLIALHLEGILEEAGHVVVGIAHSMRQALKLAAASIPFDVAVMDIDLSDGRLGIETAKRLREHHDVASLFVSGALDDHTRGMALEWQPIGFIPKPFAEEDIVQALKVLETS